uniref:Col_cuticle_N domain-containing protein n=1 Tax=Elaeophora elaphi TaxID=1147741 RepID=A0A0R3RLJ1_9BILA
YHFVQNRIKAYKFVAYSAVTFSIVAVLSICVTLPMIYNYIHHVRRQMHTEISFCKVCPHHYLSIQKFLLNNSFSKIIPYFYSKKKKKKKKK